MANDCNKVIIDAKLLIALWEDSATNVKRSNIIQCIENGANVNVKFPNNANNTPLHIAVIKGDREVVNTLLRYGARRNIENDEGKTASQLAKELPERADIADILEAHKESATEKITNPVIDTVTTATSYMYKKRTGTAGVRGQLYETKLLTLVYLRATRNKHLTQFYLGTNIDEIGDMDDVCLRFKTVSDDYVVFLQAKHKNDIVKGRVGMEDLWRTSGDFSLLKYFNSYRKIREKFNPNSDNELFRGRYGDLKCFYVMYTTIKDEIECTQKKTTVNDEVIGLIGTGEHQNVFQLKYDEQYINLLTKAILRERIRDLGRIFFKLVQDNKHNMMLNDENIRSFHVVLAQKVIKVSEVNTEGCRSGTFREEFFSSNEELMIVLRETLYEEAVKNNNLSYDEIAVVIMRISLQPINTETISELIGSVLMYDKTTNTLKLNDKGDENISKLQFLLKPLQVPRSVVNEAFEIAGPKKLRSLTFKLPAAFGNLDLTVNKKKTERRLEFLANKITSVINESADMEGNVLIHEGMYATNKYLTAGELALNGGIAGAVGNLLVSDENNKLKFNLDVDALGENSKMLLLKLKEKIVDLHGYRFVIECEDFPRLSLNATEQEKKFVADFLNNLYLYTCQAKEDQLENIGAIEIQACECIGSFSKTESRIKSNAMFLKFHNEIQNWWLTEQTASYLTRDTFHDIFCEMLNNGLLAFLNFIYLNELYNVGLEFNSDAIDVLSICKLAASDIKMIVIHTDVHVLTCRKLLQYFENLESYIFLNIDYLCRMSPNYLKLVTDELAETNYSYVVLICEDIYKCEDLIRACSSKKIIFVTANIHLATKECITVRDDKINLIDLTDTSQRKVLQTQFRYQGVDVTFAAVFDEEMKHLLDSHILEKVITKEYLTLGPTLMHSMYEEIKDYYVPRTLQRNEKFRDYTSDTSDVDAVTFTSSSEEDYRWSSEERLSSDKHFLPLTLIDHHQHISKRRQKKRKFDIILIIDAPGMGKSTLLTHLSLETKRRYPKIWIQRINLIDHTKQFHEWHEKQIEVDSVEALKFVCKIVRAKQSFTSKTNASDNNNTNIELEILNNKIKLVNHEKRTNLEAFELDVFLHCFNEGRIVFLFDGFDEVCPLYKKEVTQLLKYFARRRPLSEVADVCEQKRAEQCVWITSRPYNDLRKTLEKEFGESYTLQPFSYKDIRIYLDKYMRQNLDLNTINSNQFKNISGFFEYMKRFDLHDSAKDVALVNIPLHGVYVAAMEYFKSEIKRSHVTEDNLIYIKEWDVELNLVVAWLKHLNNYERLNEVITLSGVPLHVYIAVHYFQSQIKDTLLTDDEQLIKQWDLDTNVFAFYDRFIETKLKTIRFEEKNRMDLYNPDVRMTYEKEKKEFLDKHKKLAFYSVGSKEVFTSDELEEIKETIKRMETGEEKTGLVDRIVEGDPRFVHYTFAEYFAVGYILDCLKSSDQDKQGRMLDYVLYRMVFNATKGILNLFELKIKYDPEFVSAMTSSDTSHYILETMIDQSKEEYPYDVYEDYIGNPEDLTATTLDKAVGRGMKRFSTFLIDAVVGVVEETTFPDLMSIIEKGTFFKKLVVSDQDELVSKVLDCIRKFDASKIDDIFPYSLFDDHIHSRTSNEEFIEAYHEKILQQYYLSLLPSPNRRHMSIN